MLYQEVTESYSAIYSVCEKDLIISDLKLDFLKNDEVFMVETQM